MMVVFLVTEDLVNLGNIRGKVNLLALQLRIVGLGHEAEREFDAAADWYEQQAGLGATFVAHVREVLDRIGQMPELRAIIHRNVRRAKVRRFPYNIYYRVSAGRVEVIAVLHGHRDPSVWKGRA
jgi:toxin ParE1/3/4